MSLPAFWDAQGVHAFLSVQPEGREYIQSAAVYFVPLPLPWILTTPSFTNLLRIDTVLDLPKPVPLAICEPGSSLLIGRKLLFKRTYILFFGRKIKRKFLRSILRFYGCGCEDVCCTLGVTVYFLLKKSPPEGEAAPAAENHLD